MNEKQNRKGHEMVQSGKSWGDGGEAGVGGVGGWGATVFQDGAGFVDLAEEQGAKTEAHGGEGEEADEGDDTDADGGDGDGHQEVVATGLIYVLEDVGQGETAEIDLMVGGL